MFHVFYEELFSQIFSYSFHSYLILSPMLIRVMTDSTGFYSTACLFSSVSEPSASS